MAAESKLSMHSNIMKILTVLQLSIVLKIFGKDCDTFRSIVLDFCNERKEQCFTITFNQKKRLLRDRRPLFGFKTNQRPFKRLYYTSTEATQLSYFHSQQPSSMMQRRSPLEHETHNSTLTGFWLRRHIDRDLGIRLIDCSWICNHFRQGLKQNNLAYGKPLFSESFLFRNYQLIALLHSAYFLQKKSIISFYAFCCPKSLHQSSLVSILEESCTLLKKSLKQAHNEQ